MGDVGGHPSQTLSAEESTVFDFEVQEICLRKFTGGALLHLIVKSQRMARTQDSFNKLQFDLLGRVSVSTVLNNNNWMYLLRMSIIT